MCIKMEFGAPYNWRLMGQARGSSCKFHLHGGIKEDLTKEVMFGNLGDIGVSIGPQRQRDELIVLFRL